MARPRRIRPELLDELPDGDPRAIRSRRDLRAINTLMGNHRWLTGIVRRYPGPAKSGVIELGAGDGALLRRLALLCPDVPLTGVDLAGRPEDLPPSVKWISGDLFDHLPGLSGGILIAGLTVHHFSADQLREIGEHAQRFDLVAFVEPLRAARSRFFGRLAWPALGSVTRFDLSRSIDAGFIKGELGEQIGISSEDWEISERATLFGALRWLAIRRAPHSP